MPTSRWTPAFSAGVLGPGLHGRLDLDKYDLGLKIGENVFVHAHGGVSNRAGTTFIGEVQDSADVHRLIPFKRGDGTNYILVFGDQTMRVIKDGAFVQDGGTDYSIATPFAATDIMDVDFVQSVDVMYFAHRSYYPRKMTRTSDTSWSFSNIAIDPTIGRPGLVTFTDTESGDGNEKATYTYKVSAVTEGGIEGFPGDAYETSSRDVLDYRGCNVNLNWPDVAGADSYNVYRKRGGSYGYIGYSETSEFDDDNISADTSIAPYEAAGLFTTSDDYPGAVTIFQQRLIFASSNNLPETIWMSQVGDYENFSKSQILRDSDRVELDITGSTLNSVKYMIQLRELLVFAETGEWSVIGPQGGLPATNVAQTQYGYSGAGDVKPIVAEDTALFVDRTKRNVRDLRFALEQDGYTGNDLTIFSYHYFEGREIVDWAFQKNPFYLVWVVLDDGTLLSLTYKREHQVWAWARHDMGGDVENVAVIPEGGEDALYMIVKRTIGGSQVRYIERMESRIFTTLAASYHVDCGVTRSSGSALSTVTGLDHLEGETVSALVDGVPYSGLTVTGGSVTLPDDGKVVHVGLPFEAEIETLPPAINLEDVGSARGRPIKANKVYIQVENTTQIKAGPSSARMYEYAHSSEGAYTGTVSVPLYPDWNREGTIIVKQTYPLPMTILGMAPDYTVGRTPG